jgi:glutaredoxin 2
MSFFSSMFKRDSVPSHVPSPTETRDLVLYKYDSCPFCARVMRVVEDVGVDVEMRDVLRNRKFKTELIERTRRGMVPCLFIDDVALFESRDIVAWLQVYAQREGQ